MCAGTFTPVLVIALGYVKLARGSTLLMAEHAGLITDTVRFVVVSSFFKLILYQTKISFMSAVQTSQSHVSSWIIWNQPDFLGGKAGFSFTSCTQIRPEWRNHLSKESRLNDLKKATHHAAAHRNSKWESGTPQWESHMEKVGAVVTLSGWAALCLTFTKHRFLSVAPGSCQSWQTDNEDPEGFRKDFCRLTRQRRRFSVGARDVRS